MSRMNTEVLPLPVTPRRSAHFGASSFISFSRPLNTPCCFGENTIFDGLSDFPSVFSRRNTWYSYSSRSPFPTSRLTTAAVMFSA